MVFVILLLVLLIKINGKKSNKKRQNFHIVKKNSLNAIGRDNIGAGFLKQKIMYSYTYCITVIGFIKGNYI